MGSTSHPGIIAQLLAAAGAVPPDPFRELIIGQRGVAGNATFGEAYKFVESITNDEVGALFGVNSDLTNRILKARDKSKGRFAIWVIALEESATAVDSTLELTYAGTATEDRLMVGSGPGR